MSVNLQPVIVTLFAPDMARPFSMKLTLEIEIFTVLFCATDNERPLIVELLPIIEKDILMPGTTRDSYSVFAAISMMSSLSNKYRV